MVVDSLQAADRAAQAPQAVHYQARAEAVSPLPALVHSQHHIAAATTTPVEQQFHTAPARRQAASSLYTWVLLGLLSSQASGSTARMRTTILDITTTTIAQAIRTSRSR